MKIITGPRTSKVSRDEAVEALTTNPSFPKGAEYEVTEVAGRWVAAYAENQIEKESADFPLPSDGESDGPPASDGPPSDTDDSAPKDDSPSDSDDSSEKKDKDSDDGEKGDPIAHLTELVTKLVEALGLDDGAEGNPLPGMDGDHPGGEHDPESAPGLDAPGDTDPNEPGHQGDDGKTHTVHERALKPGEAPPGTTPIGTPAFASTHPWAKTASEKRSFTVSQAVGDASNDEVISQLRSLASEVGCQLDQLQYVTVDGQRTARALIVKA